MSTFWSVFIIVIVVAHLVGYAWLLKSTSKMPEGEKVGETTGHVFDGLEEYNNPLPRWWMWLFYLTIVFSVGYLALYPGLGNFAGLLGWTQVGEHATEVEHAEATYGPLYAAMAAKPIPELAQDASAMQTGQRIFGSAGCTVCHGADARGNPGYPNLTDNDWLWGGDPDAIKHTVMHGRTGVMPGWGAMLGEDGVEQVAHYVYTLNGRKSPAPALVAQGKEKYATTCVACHGPEGKGMTALGAPNLTDDTWLYGGSLAAIKQSVRDGRQGVMPAHKDLLGEDRAHIVAAYIYSLSAKKGGNNDNEVSAQ